MEIFDVFLLETVLNGFLFGGVLALLALGLNLVFGVIDVVWICYAELMMIGMYAVYFLYTVHHVPLLIAFVIGIATVAPVSYTHLRAHETRHDLVCRLLL